MAMGERRNVEFAVEGGVTLRGWLFVPDTQGPTPAARIPGLATEFCAPSALGRKPLRLKTQDSEPLSKYSPRKVLPISPGRLIPDAYSEGSLRVAQAQPDFPTIRISKNAPARLTRIVHTTCIPVRHAWELKY